MNRVMLMAFDQLQSQVVVHREKKKNIFCAIGFFMKLTQTSPVQC